MNVSALPPLIFQGPRQRRSQTAPYLAEAPEPPEECHRSAFGKVTGGAVALLDLSTCVDAPVPAQVAGTGAGSAVQTLCRLLPRWWSQKWSSP